MTKLNLLQLNTLNANQEKKAPELLTSVDKLEADVCILSEANADTNKVDKIEAGNNMFSNYNKETKNVNNQVKARIAMIIKKNVPYQRCKDLEDDDLSSIVNKIKETRNKIFT